MKTFDIAFIGTSLTTGPNSREWPYHLGRSLQTGRRALIRVHSLGQPAVTSNWGVANLAPLTNLRPKVAVIEFINDAYASYQNVAPENMTLAKSLSNFNAIIDGIRSSSPQTIIFLMKLVKPLAASQASLYPSLAAYDAQLDTIAANKGVGMIDTRAAWGDPDTRPEEFPSGDGVHTLLTGHRRVTIPVVSASIAPLIT